MSEMQLFNEAMLRLITRGDLENHPISKAIIAELLRMESMRFKDLHNAVVSAMKMDINEKNFRKHLDYTNDKLKAINNMDWKHEITLARIYEITVEVDGRFFTRIALVHNIRPLIEQKLTGRPTREDNKA